MITCTFEDNGKGTLRHAVITGIVIQDDKLLLIKRAENLLYEGGKWALPGGFLDRGETFEEGARREILEESGYQVYKLTLFLINSGPNRAGEDRQNVDIVFFGEAKNKIKKPDHEVSDVGWYLFAHLPSPQEIAFDHFMIITRFMEYRKKQFRIPILI
ncbi:NUDIX domain-containing protein [Candidatus Roizmanbacteria bacterium]|nr:NUDIX domain-containing protein [Candidatus Roizmanbacteria bacterium]